MEAMLVQLKCFVQARPLVKMHGLLPSVSQQPVDVLSSPPTS